MELFKKLGKIALGTRVRFLGEKIMVDAGQVYDMYGIPLNPKWFPVFYVLSEYPEKTVTTISEEIGHSHASVSKIVAEMTKARIVKLKECPEDRRRTLVSLTVKGHRMTRKIQHQYADIQSAMEELSKQSKNDLWRAIEEWEELLSEKSLLERIAEKKRVRESGQKIKIVEYQTKYQKAFRDLNTQWIEQYFKMEKPDHDALDNPESYILNKGGHIFVALNGDEPVGVCALLKREDSKYPYEMAKMAVDPKCRGLNIGGLLGQAVVEKARSLGAKYLYLESNTVLKPAIGLYKKLGFQKVKGDPSPYARANIQMELKL